MLISDLNRKVFLEDNGSTIYPDEQNVTGFDHFLERYKQGLSVELQPTHL